MLYSNCRMMPSLAFTKILHDNLRKMGNPVPPALQWRWYVW